MKYAIIQKGYACFGVGDTIAEAIADASEWTSDIMVETDLKSFREAAHGEMCAVKCTTRYADAVKRRGGQIEYEYTDDGFLDMLSASSIGRKGGTAKSSAKQNSSRENGKKGGRPKGSGKKKEGQ